MLSLINDVPLRTRRALYYIGRCTESMSLAPLWFSTEHRWRSLTRFWFWADDISFKWGRCNKVLTHTSVLFRYSRSKICINVQVNYGKKKLCNLTNLLELVEFNNYIFTACRLVNKDCKSGHVTQFSPKWGLALLHRSPPFLHLTMGTMLIHVIELGIHTYSVIYTTRCPQLLTYFSRDDNNCLKALFRLTRIISVGLHG